ncbi:MAG: NAD-dependent malic enzyme [Legionella sp.]
MLEFKTSQDPMTGDHYIETSICGKHLLTTPQLNKGTAFTREERKIFGLLGKLPNRIETIDEQVERAYTQFMSYNNSLKKNIYLNNLHDKNQVLFYKLLSCHLGEMLPIIYTPIVGTAVKSFSREYRQPRGLYITYNDIELLDEIIGNRSNPNIDLIVVTDGEGVLGIGDQGIGGMDIPVAKLMVYSICGGIDPTSTLPVFLDVGTNNEELLNDPMYLGCRHPRIGKEQYDELIAAFVKSINKHFPQAFLHWEDLGRNNARRVLDQYQNQLCTFNDDIQGTGAVTLAALLAACQVTNTALQDNRIVVYGAGSAGTGISDQVIDALISIGLSPQEAYSRFWLIDRQGLLLEDDPDLTPAQVPFARRREEVSDWHSSPNYIPSLLDTVKQVKPTILIGCSAHPGAFNQDIIETMSLSCQRPIIFPLSNPDEKCEAQPADILAWSKGTALIATGTHFDPVSYEHRMIEIAQCNNALIFPGIGLGILAVKAKRLSKAMIYAASQALCEFSPSKHDSFSALLPALNDAQSVAKYIAEAVAHCAIEEGLAQCNQEKNLGSLIENIYWQPRYLPFKKIEATIRAS